MRHSHPPARESGQAAVEAALTVPMMVFLVLGIIQLTMLHHARLMTEYAAYRAARAGIVDGGACTFMEDSAVLAVLPTLGPVGFVPGRTDTLMRAILIHDTFKAGELNTKKYKPTSLKVIDVQVLNPKKSQLTNLFNTYGTYSARNNKINKEEIDFDDIRDSTVIAANLLTVRVTYNYEMRIPFANRLIHGWYMGYAVLDSLHGVQFDVQQGVGGVGESEYLEDAGIGRGGIYAQLGELAKTRHMYVIPLVATYSMRMQSNLIKKQVQDCAI
jgi:hypothetical protein